MIGSIYVLRICLLCGIFEITNGNLADWLVQKIQIPTTLTQTDDKHVILTNGLITREFTTVPDFATVEYYSDEQESSLLRAINPESQIKLDGILYNIGGLKTSIPRAYLNRTALRLDMKKDSNAFHYVSHQEKTPEAPYPYKPRRGAPKDIVWPPKGLRVDVLFRAPVQAPAAHKMINITMHYEMYEGIPLMSKWITASADPAVWGKVTFELISLEYLAVNWQWAQGGYGWMYIETDRPHGTLVDWITDPESEKMPGSFEQVVNCYYAPSPRIPLDHEIFSSFQVRELVIGSSDPERFGLGKRKMLRLLAPQSQENPIYAHSIHADSTRIRALIDQIAEVGFEMVIYSFGSHFNLESNNETYIAHIAHDVAYARSKNIEVGGYDLLATTRKTQPEWMTVHTSQHPSPTHAACLASGFYEYLVERITNFMAKTGITQLNADGCYKGITCTSKNHSHHLRYDDSVYKQDLLMGKFFIALREKELSINHAQPYFYQGGNRAPLGYKEHQFSLPHWQDLSVSRQDMFDDTFHYIPTAGWMFLPESIYHGGGSAAAFYPQSENKEAYNFALAQYFGAGVQAAYRGFNLYDNLETKAIVIKWVSFFKKYRDILTSDIIHVRRADMQSIDCLMHVNPFLDNKALAMVFNPTDENKSMNLTLPLYYSGISDVAYVSAEGGPPKRYTLNRSYKIVIPVGLPPKGVTWYIIQGQ